MECRADAELVRDSAALALDRRGLAEAVQHHVASGLGERARDPEPNPARRTGYDCSSAFRHCLAPRPIKSPTSIRCRASPRKCCVAIIPAYRLYHCIVHDGADVCVNGVNACSRIALVCFSRASHQSSARMVTQIRQPEDILAFRPLRQVLASKPRSLWSVAPADPVMSALQIMADKDIGFLVVLDRRCAGRRRVGARLRAARGAGRESRRRRRRSPTSWSARSSPSIFRTPSPTACG